MWFFSRKHHWEAVYQKASPSELSWHQLSPEVSLSLLEATGMGNEARVIDVGGGASTLVDSLLDRGYTDISVLDLSPAAISHAQKRLGARRDLVTWLVGDVRGFEPEQPFDVWHDRAALHFLTGDDDRRAYADVLTASMKPGGHAIISTFSLNGAKKCSGLRVKRYGPKEIEDLLGERFDLLESRGETHITPGGVRQPFTYFRLRRRRNAR